ncbi:MAG: rubrerythrin family protein [Clostridia bacterium]|nr:rubrerythrin family protein [Clostridia bacterium]
MILLQHTTLIIGSKKARFLPRFLHSLEKIANFNLKGVIFLTNFKESQTKTNLMRAFAGESQARNRYTFAAEIAKKQGLYVIEAVFKYTADQELAHANVFMKHLSELNGETVEIDGGYPVEVTNSVIELLENAVHNETEEYEDVYKSFAETAEQEGILNVAGSFKDIANIENEHAKRFKMFAELLKQNKLFVSDAECDWVCLNCGNIYKGKSVPEVCPVCYHEKGYFIRLELAPYTK